jgi:radical SAM protein with 4Fe4S-binding SPASM domain
VRARPVRIICSLDADDDATYRAMRGPRADFDRAVRGVQALLEANRRLAEPVPVVVRLIRTRINEHQAEAFQARWGAHAEVRPFFPWNDPELAHLGDWEHLPPGMPCPFPWRYLVVQWNGDVVPCCRDCDGEVVLGNVAGQTLKEIWNGPEYKEFRRRLAEPGRPAGMCGPCMDLYGTPEAGR